MISGSSCTRNWKRKYSIIFNIFKRISLAHPHDYPYLLMNFSDNRTKTFTDGVLRSVQIKLIKDAATSFTFREVFPGLAAEYTSIPGYVRMDLYLL